MAQPEIDINNATTSIHQIRRSFLAGSDLQPERPVNSKIQKAPWATNPKGHHSSYEFIVTLVKHPMMPNGALSTTMGTKIAP
ncbi:hypothetical protein [Roseimicrobium sp. ORNL1]|uniref:hypothetical protein n=1 Tax=Roseimicrobium sp. ORNL1 TaxID=2711231 RepID=UPI0013E175B1|nr:hypothetical protein [Roseimicrobium sp. ORNL1]QIF05575.1 hypothetical protein G5S37_30115 [Roseimicrobium sp. ORNL1]